MSGVRPQSGDRIPEARVKRKGPALTEYTPCEKGVYFTSLRKAVEQTWGADALACVAADMPEDSRLACFGDLRPGEWVPERHFIAFNLALWAGPVARNREAYERCIELTMSLSFGVIRRTLLQLASPRAVLERAPRLWADDHTHGELEVAAISDRQATLRLREHPFVDFPQGRAAIAYSLRCVVALCGVKKAVVSHGPDGDALRVKLAWE